MSPFLPPPFFVLSPPPTARATKANTVSRSASSSTAPPPLVSAYTTATCENRPAMPSASASSCLREYSRRHTPAIASSSREVKLLGKPRACAPSALVSSSENRRSAGAHTLRSLLCESSSAKITRTANAPGTNSTHAIALHGGTRPSVELADSTRAVALREARCCRCCFRSCPLCCGEGVFFLVLLLAFVFPPLNMSSSLFYFTLG